MKGLAGKPRTKLSAVKGWENGGGSVGDLVGERSLIPYERSPTTTRWAIPTRAGYATAAPSGSRWLLRPSPLSKFPHWIGIQFEMCRDGYYGLNGVGH